MLMPILKSIAEERASIARDVEYMREMTNDTCIAARILEVESSLKPTMEKTEEAETAEIFKHFVCESDETRDEEINRILKSEEDLTFDKMIGIE